MLDCRYYDLCCFTDDSCNGEPECPKRDHCQFYSPMPDVKALLALADELQFEQPMGRTDYETVGKLMDAMDEAARSIREALGVVG